jgi:hypothetical protein
VAAKCATGALLNGLKILEEGTDQTLDEMGYKDANIITGRIPGL